MVLSFRGTTIQVKEGVDGRCSLVVSEYRQDTDKKFPGACREAVKYLLDNAGKIDESVYERES